MLIPRDLATWMTGCGVPVRQYAKKIADDCISVSVDLEKIIFNGTLVYSFLNYLGRKASSRKMIEFLRTIHLSSGDSRYVIIDNWAQLFPVLNQMGIQKSEDDKQKIRESGLKSFFRTYFLIYKFLFVI